MTIPKNVPWMRKQTTNNNCHFRLRDIKHAHPSHFLSFHFPCFSFLILEKWYSTCCCPLESEFNQFNQLNSISWILLDLAVSFFWAPSYTKKQNVFCSLGFSFGSRCSFCHFLWNFPPVSIFFPVYNLYLPSIVCFIVYDSNCNVPAWKCSQHSVRSFSYYYLVSNSWN